MEFRRVLFRSKKKENPLVLAQVTALKFGLPLADFWRMTPYEFKTFVRAMKERQEDERARDRFVAFYSAAGVRIKDLRDLPGLMDGPSKKKPSQGVDRKRVG